MTAAKTDQTKQAKTAEEGALRRFWKRACANGKQTGGFLRGDFLQPAAIAGSVLLATTALATPVMATTIGAAAVALGSIWLLTKTSDVVANNASALGAKLGIPPILLGIGLGIVTSLPELAVSIGSIMAGVPDMAVGNIVGSNIANILLVLGAGAAIKPVNSKGASWKFNTAVMLGTTALFAGQMAMGVLNPVMGGAMLVGLGAYIWRAAKVAQQDKKNGFAPDEEDDNTAEGKMPKWFNAAWGVAGVAGLVASAKLLVTSASITAIGLGVTPALVGALGVAVGTSLPELAVTVKSALQGKSDMALGNILGSNIFNVLMVGGALALAGTAVPLAFGLGSAMGILNIGAFVGAAALSATAMFMNKSKGSIKRWQGGLALGLYTAFTAASVALDPGAADAEKNKTAATEPTVIEQPQQQREGFAPARLAAMRNAYHHGK